MKILNQKLEKNVRKNLKTKLILIKLTPQKFTTRRFGMYCFSLCILTVS